MSSERYLQLTTFVAFLLFVLLLAACGQRPPIETTILPAANETPTAFDNLAVAPTAAEATPAPSDPATSLGQTPTVQATATIPANTPIPLATATNFVPATIQPNASPTSTLTITETLALSGTPAANATPVASAAISGTLTPNAPACFGGVTGSVVADLNQNGQPEAGEPGVMDAKLFLYNTSGVVGLYTTGNGQYYFPGLVAGKYTLTVAPPSGYTTSGSPSYDFVLLCGDNVTKNFLLLSSAAATPTGQSGGRINPVAGAQGTPRASRSGAGVSNFKPFEVAAVYDIAGCGSLTAPGLYRLVTSLTSQWDCIQIYSDNVIFDCQGYSLNGTELNGYGVVVHQIGNLLSQRAPRNIEIRNCNSSKHKYGIFVDAADNLYIHDNNLSNNYRDTDPRNFGQFLGLTEGGGIRIGSTTNALIADNRTDNNAIGIDVRTGSGIAVRGNIANGNTAWGVHFYNVQYSEISDNQAADNLRYCTWGNGTVGPGCDAGGIMLQAGSNKNVVKNNTITGSNGNGIFIKAHGTPCGDGNIISGNTITGALYNAIELSFCSDNTIAGNKITNSLDGIWLGFAKKNTVNGGNELRDLSNHGIISWNSSENNVSTNTIINSREGLYFYSSDYDRAQFFFVSGSPADHISTQNCLCDNTLIGNAVAAIHLNNSLKNQITENKLTNNGVNFIMEGNTAGNIIQDNVIQGGSFYIGEPRAQFASFSNRPNALTAYDSSGRPLSRAEFIRVLTTDSPLDSFDLRWFKFKLRISLGLK